MTLVAFVVLLFLAAVFISAAEVHAHRATWASQFSATLYASFATVCGAGLVYLVLRPFLGT